MAKRRFELSEQEIRQFRAREQETSQVMELKRLQAVRLYGTGASVRQIMEMTGCAESSIREWVQDYKRDGLNGLAVHYERSAQNSSKLTPDQRTELREKLHQYSPDQVLAPTVRLSQGRFWTVSDLQLAVEQWYGVVYRDQSMYHRLFHRSGFSYQRTERVYKSRPSEADIAAFEAQLEKK
jgi:transposase